MIYLLSVLFDHVKDIFNALNHLLCLMLVLESLEYCAAPPLAFECFA